jgi:hypothetical protein
MKVARLSAIHSGRLYLKETSLVLTSVKRLSRPQCHSAAEWSSEWKPPVTTSEIEPTSFRLVARCQIHVLQYVIRYNKTFIFIIECVFLSTFSIIRLFSYPSSFRSRSLTDIWSFTVLNYSILRKKSKLGIVSLNVKLINLADRYVLNPNNIASVNWDQNIFLEGNYLSQRMILQCSARDRSKRSWLPGTSQSDKCADMYWQ